MELLIKGARVVDYRQDFTGDVYINEGIILETGKKLDKNCKTMNGEGLVLLPSFVDLHSHFRDPGLTHKEDIVTGSRAAVRGGYTAVNLMANTKPVADNMDIFNYAANKGRETGLVDINQTITITKNMDGRDLSHIEALTDEVKFLSDDGRGILSNKVMLEAMQRAKKKGYTIIEHVEDEELVALDTRLSENLMTVRDLRLSEYTGCRLHIAHVSTREAMEDIIASKKRGANVTCEVTPHHIGLWDEISTYRVNPPIRSKKDVDFLINAIKEGYVDAIGTDHAPHTAEDKAKGSPGLVGLETAFSVCYTKLVRDGHITLNKLSEIMSKNPSEIMKINKGKIETGCDADLVLVDIEEWYRVNTEEFASKGKNTPFAGMDFYGKVLTTIKGGKIVYDRGLINDNRQAL